ncbi:MAG: SDR family oxidoreductase [Ilyomonas sp.]
MKKVLVTGGTGNLGRCVVNDLLQKNVEVSILTTKSDIQWKDVEVFEGDLAKNISLTQATAKADIIIHCASNAKDFQQADIQGTENLLHSLNRKGLQNFIYISIVGIDKSSYPYYQAKLTVEKMIINSGIPHTILRTTQFHSFVLNMLLFFINEQSKDVITIPAGMKFQSVDIREVAQQLTANLEKAKGILHDFGGPQILSFEEMTQIYLNIIKTKADIETTVIESPRYELFRSGINLCPDNAFGKITWGSFIEEPLKHS